jgi:hypothetical protein
MDKKYGEVEKELSKVKMQYKLSICNNETLMKGLKSKLNAFEEKKEKIPR